MSICPVCEKNAARSKRFRILNPDYEKSEKRKLYKKTWRNNRKKNLLPK